jgi:hypothetical protein
MLRMAMSGKRAMLMLNTDNFRHSPFRNNKMENGGDFQVVKSRKRGARKSNSECDRVGGDDEARRTAIRDSRAQAEEWLSNAKSRALIVDDVQAQLARLMSVDQWQLMKRFICEQDLMLREFVRNEKELGSSTSGAEPNTAEIVCYGIGSIALSAKARSQLAVLLSLRDSVLRSSSIVLYDPVLSPRERQLLAEQYDIGILDENDEARRSVARPTLFFMPHCPRGLYHNVVSANEDRLQRIAIIGNSFARYALINSPPVSGAVRCVRSTDLNTQWTLVEQMSELNVVRELSVPDSIDATRDALRDQSLHTFDVTRASATRTEWVSLCDTRPADAELLRAQFTSTL